MKTTSLTRRTAADLMQTEVVTIGPRQTLQDAMTAMTENHVTGLPVIDQKDRCVGLISATDILNYEQEHATETSAANAELARYFDPETQRWEDMRLTTFALEEFADTPVSELMCRDLVFVRPDASIRVVARKMIDEEVHRVLVLDEERYLLGIISSVDFVRLFAAAKR